MLGVSLPPVLVVGGSGIVGAVAAKTLRWLQPELPITIAGRDLAKATHVAASIAGANAARVDLDRADLGLAPEQSFSAVVMFVKDDTLSSMRFAQERGIPYVSISTGSFEVAPEVARYAQRPSSAAILMGSHWLAGAASLPALYFARDFESVERIVQEEAETHLRSRIARIGNLGGFACRPRNSRKGASLSAHAFGSAVDISAFHPVKGAPAIIVRDYAEPKRPSQPQEVRRNFLHAVFRRLRRDADLTYAVGPDFNAAHRDHFHLDRGGWHFWFHR